jgi:hypothetical protein
MSSQNIVFPGVLAFSDPLPKARGEEEEWSTLLENKRVDHPRSYLFRWTFAPGGMTRMWLLVRVAQPLEETT